MEEALDLSSDRLLDDDDVVYIKASPRNVKHIKVGIECHCIN